MTTEYTLALAPEVERELKRIAKAQRVKPETLIREIVREFVGRAK